MELDDLYDEESVERVVKVSHSRQNTALTCGKRYYLAYKEGWYPFVRKHFFVTGDISHQSTELFWKDRSLSLKEAYRQGRRIVSKYLKEEREKRLRDAKYKKLDKDQVFMDKLHEDLELSRNSAMMGLIYGLCYKKNFIDKNPHLSIAIINGEPANELRIESSVIHENIRYDSTSICDRILWDSDVNSYKMEELKNFAASRWVKDAATDTDEVRQIKNSKRDFKLRNNTQTKKYVYFFEQEFGIEFSDVIYNVIMKTGKKPSTAVHEEVLVNDKLLGETVVSYITMTQPKNPKAAPKEKSSKGDLEEEFGKQPVVTQEVLDWLKSKGAIRAKTKRSETFYRYLKRIFLELMQDDYVLSTTVQSMENVSREGILKDIIFPSLKICKRAEDGDMVMAPSDPTACDICSYHDYCANEHDEEKLAEVIRYQFNKKVKEI